MTDRHGAGMAVSALEDAMTRRDAIDAAVARALARVAACGHRGPVLPVSQQPECGCAELSECRAGKGRVPGRVALSDCVRCVGGT